MLRGNLAPDGAVIKPSAASPHLLRHKGRAVVFESIEDLHARIDDENLDIDEHCIMVLKGCGPKGYPGMAEVGNMPLPPKLLRRGITDILRISDARMSGTAYGAVVLHVSPEAAAGGPLALVRNGDIIEVDVPARRLHLDVSETELAHAARQLEAGAGADARLVQAVRRSRAAGASRRRSRRARGRQRRRRHARHSLEGLRATSETAAEAAAYMKFSRERIARVSLLIRPVDSRERGAQLQ